jgi:iron(III) transport system permease protein
VRAHALAGDERLAEAALPALMIVLAGLGPIVWLSRQIIGARAGAHLQTLHVAEAAR